MKENTFYTILPFMVNDLKLSGNELLIYAIVYGFSQDGESWFYGSRKYLSECTNVSTVSVTRCLKSLTEKGFIERKEVTDKKGNHVEYRASKESLLGGVVKNLNGGSKESLPNNINNNNLSISGMDKTTNEGFNRYDTFRLEQPVWVDLFDADLEPSFSVQCLRVFNDITGWDMPNMPQKATECLNLRSNRYTLEQVGGMVKMKREQWEGTKIERNLKPSTLFSPDHFDEYMQEYLHQNDEREFSDDEIPY